MVLTFLKLRAANGCNNTHDNMQQGVQTDIQQWWMFLCCCSCPFISVCLFMCTFVNQDEEILKL